MAEESVAEESVETKSTPRIELKKYSESSDHHASGLPEPVRRSQTLIYYIDNDRWWITVTLLGPIAKLLENLGIQQQQHEQQQAPYRERREFFRSFVQQLDYKTLPLLADTVTEIILGEYEKDENDETNDNDENDENITTPGLEVEVTVGTTTNMTETKGNAIPTFLRCRIQEDPLRVVYPSCDEFPFFRRINYEELTKGADITDYVYWVSNGGAQYVLKMVNRAIYYPEDTEVIRKELENLEYFAGVPNIAQAAGVAVSMNPYQTSTTGEKQLVIVGILLEAYLGGSLKQVLTERRVSEHCWEKWAVQIGTALECFHKAKKTHMDLKPSNIVLDIKGNAVIIDISGTGLTLEWCAPAIWYEGRTLPFEYSFEERQFNDIWAYGKILSEIVSQAEDGPYAKTLHQVVDTLMVDDIGTQTSLSSALSQLKGADNQA
ncbi:kinase-like protein [Aspergillus indologenus CBS 114.80]|uniref:Kinase-like protein n=1 Tax=Aspergillus indologenus CBS 114.80 TaxID=1450541 RepID=A0A2V5IMF0_9EURO|nr:kinase-like protein [Aspergillus indologenus CBS 114.80]